jgi:hypothetical protein
MSVAVLIKIAAELNAEAQRKMIFASYSMV